MAPILLIRVDGIYHYRAGLTVYPHPRTLILIQICKYTAIEILSILKRAKMRFMKRADLLVSDRLPLCHAHSK